MSAFTVIATRDTPAPRGWRGLVFHLWQSLTGQASVARLRASKSFCVSIEPRNGEPVFVNGYATDDGDLTIVVEHRGSPRLKWTTKRPAPEKRSG